MNLFHVQPRKYDQWYNENPGYYLSELKALSLFLPQEGKGVEIWVGTGRFVDPLGIKTGVDSSENIAALAQERGVRVFYSPREVESLLIQAGFLKPEFLQTLFEGKSKRIIQPVEKGHD